jgi:hypothetical protein
MKTSIFFHETFRISSYHIYLPPPKIWKESERFVKTMILPVPPLVQIGLEVLWCRGAKKPNKLAWGMLQVHRCRQGGANVER